MSQFFQIHPENPQPRLIKQAAQIIHQGGIVALPTDSCYALVCHLDDKDAVTRLRRIRGVDEKHHLTLLCRDLSEIANYAKVDNRQYRVLKAATPGPFTVILEATKEVPRRLSHPSRKTIGLRVPEHKIANALLEELGQALLGTTLILPDHDEPLNDAETIRDALEKQIELVIDGEACTMTPTTVIDMTSDDPVLVRRGRGDPRVFGLDDQD
ncbi:L-threonylcarbamoyladenylate synthase [Undibacterium luofuense]|uniref:Threonylcarbamoyl-AMP synthase n=1 Tax=Undibacterium luofuense TaxID=2828733 RepID=A0A941DQC2_9BURK|nr:L-threonylcarbamoyladenylate synthase [Undibacterium luofuense]MBR7784095.1 threonylcarbamoyl-AMP synthase [Undibacterium luofuense]